jgi:hypothetical protein
MTGCKVTVTTLSVEQNDLGGKRIKGAGLESRISILLCDYRDTPRVEGGMMELLVWRCWSMLGRTLWMGILDAMERRKRWRKFLTLARDTRSSRSSSLNMYASANPY